MIDNPFRNLVCAGVDYLFRNDCISLSATDGCRGDVFCELFGKPAKIKWRYDHYGGEILVSVWLGVKAGCIDEGFEKPTNKHLCQVVDACASAWIETLTGRYIQGFGDRDIHAKYCSQRFLPAFRCLPRVKVEGVGEEGRCF